MDMWKVFLIFVFVIGVQCQNRALKVEREQLSSTKEEIKPRTGASSKGVCGRPLGTLPDAGTGGVQSANNGEWPWQAMILRYWDSDTYYTFLCSGTLIAKQWIISAAHCFDINVPSHTAIILSAHDATLADKNYVRVAVGAILCHPQFSRTTMENDICLVKLSTQVDYSHRILPVCLPSPTDNLRLNEKCVVTGWGDKTGTGNESTLQEATVHKSLDMDCSSNFICIDDANGTCFPYTGGPLVCNKTKTETWHYELFGVSSSPRNCSSNTNPLAYTDVTKYLDWIETTKSKSPDITMCFDKSTIRRCGSTIVTNGTIVRSPAIDYQLWHYPSNTDCSWTFRAPVGYFLTFRFLCFMAIERTNSTGSSCSDDYLQIKEADGTKKKYCGSYYVDKMNPYSTFSNEATMTFHSNSRLSGSGFVIQVVFEKFPDSDQCFKKTAIHTCNSLITVNNTIIRSPATSLNNWMYSSKSIDCSWIVRAPPGHTLTFEYLCFFSTKASSFSSTCDLSDYLRIKPNNERGLQQCGTFNVSKLQPYRVNGSEATLTFRSRSGSSDKGFVIRVVFSSSKAIQVPDSDQCFNKTAIHTCNSLITVNNTIIRSPATSFNNWMYSNKPIDCSWIVRAPPGHTLKFEYLCFFSTTTSSFSSTCDSSDYLLIQPKNERGLRRCGTFNVSKLQPYKVNGNEATLTFYSQTGSTDKGFVIRVVFSSSKAIHTLCVPLTMLAILLSLFHAFNLDD